MIRKEGKARWTYTCEPCGITHTAVDQFRAVEACHLHERSIEHGFKLIVQALKPVLDVVESFASAFASPPNLPHDPSRRRDRRKWGGR